MAEEAFVPLEEVARYFAVSISTVRSWIRNGDIPALKVGGVYRFKLSETEEAIRKMNGDVPIAQIYDVNTAQVEFDFNPNDDV